MLIVMHYREFFKTTGTAPLLAESLRGCVIEKRGQVGARLDGGGLLGKERRHLLLYPSLDAVELTEELVALDTRPITLVVPDGNWTQAKRIHRREALLCDIQRVRLPSGTQSHYAVRKNRRTGEVSTLEAVARALSIIHPGAGDPLIRLQEAFVRGTLASRGNPQEPGVASK